MVWYFDKCFYFFPSQIVKECNEGVRKMSRTEELISIEKTLEFKSKVKEHFLAFSAVTVFQVTRLVFSFHVADLKALCPLTFHIL